MLIDKADWPVCTEKVNGINCVESTMHPRPSRPIMNTTILTSVGSYNIVHTSAVHAWRFPYQTGLDFASIPGRCFSCYAPGRLHPPPRSAAQFSLFTSIRPVFSKLHNLIKPGRLISLTPLSSDLQLGGCRLIASVFCCSSAGCKENRNVCRGPGCFLIWHLFAEDASLL